MFVSEKKLLIKDIRTGKAKASGNAYTMLSVADRDQCETYELFVRDGVQTPPIGQDVKVRIQISSRGYTYAGYEKA